MSIVVRLARRQTIVAEVEACAADILTRADIPLSVEVGDSTCLLLDGLTAQIDCIGGDLAISHATYVALDGTLGDAPCEQADGCTLAFCAGVPNKYPHTVTPELGEVFQPLTLEASTLEDDEEWRIERFSCMYGGLLRLGDS